MTIKSMPENWSFCLKLPVDEDQSVRVDGHWNVLIDDEVSAFGLLYTFEGPLKVDVVAHGGPDGYEIEICLSSTILMPCSRCLKQVEVAINESFRYRYMLRSGSVDEEEAVESDDDVLLVVVDHWGQKLDVTLEVWECFIMSLPQFVLCREDCDGLSRAVADMPKEVVDPRFQALADLKEEFEDTGKGGNQDGDTQE